MDHTVETLPNNTKVWINQEHRFGTDSLLLSSFCQAKKNWNICDLGSGCGIIALSLIDKGVTGNVIAVELDASGTALLNGTCKENNYANVTAICQDIKHFKSPPIFDLVVANPPYFNQGILPKTTRKASARHETTASLSDFCKAASQLLKDKARFCVCFPPNRLINLITALHANKLEPKRLQFVRNNIDAEPWLVLVDARKAGGSGITILPDRILPHGQPITY